MFGISWQIPCFARSMHKANVTRTGERICPTLTTALHIPLPTTLGVINHLSATSGGVESRDGCRAVSARACRALTLNSGGELNGSVSAGSAKPATRPLIGSATTSTRFKIVLLCRKSRRDISGMRCQVGKRHCIAQITVTFTILR